MSTKIQSPAFPPLRMDCAAEIMETFRIDPTTEANFGGSDDSYALAFQKEGFHRLAIEKIGWGPGGLPAVSIAFYGKQNGDAMRSPEICFEVREDGLWRPYYFRNDYDGVELEVCSRDSQGDVKGWDVALMNKITKVALRLDQHMRQEHFVEYARVEYASRCSAKEGTRL